jgi:sec-independent protein translocase protein TatB
MNFLGIGPGEFFFILILALLVIGPERLPGFARSIGRGIVRLRNWINNSPDAQVLLQVQRELEAEISDIRTTLRQEVQNVRAEMEMVRSDLEQASRTVDTSVSSATTSANVAFPTNTIANPATANLTPITSSDLTTPMRLNVSDVAAAQAESAEPAAPAVDTTTPVSRSRKPNWATPDVDANPTATAETHAPVSDTQPTTDETPIPPASRSEAAPDTPSTAPTTSDSPLDEAPVRPQLANSGIVPAAGVVPSTSTQPSSAEIAALQQEIRQIKSASPSISHDSFMMMKVEVEQLGRDLKKLREEMTKQKPTNSVSYDDMMMMRVQIGQLSHQLDQLNRQLAAAKSDVEPSA